MPWRGTTSIPTHFRRLLFWMGNEQVPNERLKRFGVRRDVRAADGGHDCTDVRHLLRKPSVASHNSTNFAWTPCGYSRARTKFALTLRFASPPPTEKTRTI